MILALAAACGAAHGGALTVVQERWGFDGYVVPNRFNVLSIELTNPLPVAFNGVLRLYRGDGIGRRSATFVQECYLTPGASRWVQFFPHIGQYPDAFTLEWTGAAGRERADLRAPVLGAPGWALLRDESDPLPPKAALPVFSDGLFPPTVAATDGCHALFLDHTPRWEPVRQEAFLDWLRRGGHLFLLHGPTGRYPSFGEALAVLNNPADRFRVGAGQVIRLAFGPAGLSREALGRLPVAQPTMEQVSNPRVYDLQDEIFEAIGSLSVPHHQWELIYLITLAYLALVGPVHYLFAKNRRDYRPTLAFFLLTVLGCSLLLAWLGQRGQNEANAVHSISYARQIDATHYDVAQWGSAFVIRGAVYDLAHGAPNALYGSAREMIRPGEVHTGPKAHFRVDIPLNSFQFFLFRGKLPGDPIRLRVTQWDDQEGRLDLAIQVDSGPPTPWAGMWAVCGTECYPLVRGGGSTLRTASAPANLNTFAGRVRQGPRYRGMVVEEPVGDPTLDAVTVPLGRLLVCHAAGGMGALQYSIKFPNYARDIVRVFLLAPSPESFHVQGRGLGQRGGYTLYEIELARP